jgi:integrase
MPRPRKHDKHLPQYMRFKHGAYYFVRKDKWTRLSTSLHEAFAKYSMMMTPDGKISTMSDLFDRYIAEVVPTKAINSQKNQVYQFNYLRAAFGNMQPNMVKPTDVYAYIDMRSSKSSANREKTLLSHVFLYAIRWGICTTNPCAHVQSFKEKPRDRLVSAEEMEAILKIAPELMKIIIKFAITTGIRQHDILNFRLSQITDEGLEVIQHKTGKGYIIEWNDMLHSIILEAKKYSSSEYLFTIQEGKPYTSSGFKSAWQRLMRKAIRQGLIEEKFTFHDLRAMTVTNAYEKLGLQAASDIAGHSDTRITQRVYVRNKNKVKLPE